MPLSAPASSIDFSAFGPVVTPAPTDEFVVRQADGITRIETRAQVHALEAGEHLILPQVNEPATPTLAFGDGNTGFIEAADNDLRVVVAGVSRWRWAGTTYFGLTAGAPQLIDAVSSATLPNINPDRGDSNTGIGSGAADQLSLIAGGVQVANCVEAAGVVQFIVPQQNNATFPSIAFGDGDTGFYESADDTIFVSVLAAPRVKFTTTEIAGAAFNNFTILHAQGLSATAPAYTWNLDLDTGLGHGALDTLSLIAGGLDCINIAEVGAARQVGFYVTPAISLQTGVAVTAAGVHAALVALGLITA